MDQTIINFLSKLEFGELQTFKNMAIIPLLSSVNHTIQYLSLGEAMRNGFLTVTEVSQGGSVPELKVLNKGICPSCFLTAKSLQGQSRTGS